VKIRKSYQTERLKCNVTLLAIFDNFVFKFNRLIGSKNFSCFSKRSEMKSTLASAPNACPVDKTIEKIFMKLSKSHGGAGGGSAGLSGLLSNSDAYQRWVRAAHERVQFVKGAQITMFLCVRIVRQHVNHG
jgi:hypothetical protein